MWWVDTDALLSSSPSLIWLQLGLGLAGAVTIKGSESVNKYCDNGNFLCKIKEINKKENNKC